MNWPLAFGLAAAWIVLPPLAIIALKGRRTLLSRADDLSNQDAERNGKSFDHGALNTQRSRNDHE